MFNVDDVEWHHVLLLMLASDIIAQVNFIIPTISAIATNAVSMTDAEMHAKADEQAASPCQYQLVHHFRSYHHHCLHVTIAEMNAKADRAAGAQEAASLCYFIRD